MLDENLVSAYLATDFCVDDGVARFVLNVGHISRELKSLYGDYEISSAAFITAYNPASEPLSEIENLKRHQSLVAKVSGRWSCLDGYGADSAGEWPPEKSILMLGVGLNYALALGVEYGQNAIVFCDTSGVPQLYECETGKCLSQGIGPDCAK